jgi:hypothetical protein
MPKRPSQEDGPENEQDRGKARCLDFGGILGPRVQEIEAAAEIIGGFNESSLRCLAARGDFGVKRPLRKPDKFGAEHDVFLSDDGLRVFKHARNYGSVSAKQGIVPIDLQIAELSGPLLKLAADVVALSGRAPRSG